jgi:hypothetical protein
MSSHHQSSKGYIMFEAILPLVAVGAMSGLSFAVIGASSRKLAVIMLVAVTSAAAIAILKYGV